MLTFLLSVLTSDWLKTAKVNKTSQSVCCCLFLYWSRSTTERSGITQRLVDLIADILYFRDLGFGQIYDTGFGKTQIILTGNVIWLLPGRRYSPKFRARSCKIFLSVYRTEFGGKPYVLAQRQMRTIKQASVQWCLQVSRLPLPFFRFSSRFVDILRH